MNTKYKVISVDNWERKELFKAYQSFEDPCFNISFELDVAPLYRFAKENKISFFLLTLYAISRAMNSVPEMRRRIIDGDSVAEYEVVHPSAPIMREGTNLFAQTTIPYADTFAEFRALAEPIIAAAKKSTRASLLEGEANVFGASCLPWFSASGLSAATFEKNQSTPLLTWFKMTPAGTLTIAGRFNHSFVDGFHIGKFVKAIEENFAHPENL